MKKFQEFLNESKTVTVYHGNKYGTSKINPKHMDSSINEHGVGIYFTDEFNTSKMYGEHVVKAEINPSDFIESRSFIEKLGKSFFNLLKYLYKIEPEGIWYLVTDYGMEVFNPEDVEESHLYELYKIAGKEQIRHMQQTLVDNTSVEDFVEGWLKTIKYKGTYQKQQTGETFYMIIDPNVKLEKVI